MVPVASDTLRTIIVNPVEETEVTATAYLGELVAATTDGATVNLDVGKVTVVAVSWVLMARAVPPAVVVRLAATLIKDELGVVQVGVAPAPAEVRI